MHAPRIIALAFQFSQLYTDGWDVDACYSYRSWLGQTLIELVRSALQLVVAFFEWVGRSTCELASFPMSFVCRCSWLARNNSI
jgi:hypothetical protein